MPLEPFGYARAKPKAVLEHHTTKASCCAQETDICSAVAAVCDRRVQLPRICRNVLPQRMLGKNRRRSQNAATKAVDWRAPLWCEVNSALEGDAGSELAAVRGSACTELWTTRKSSLQSNRKRCWSTALQNVLYQHLRICGIQFRTARGTEWI